MAFQQNISPERESDTPPIRLPVLPMSVSRMAPIQIPMLPIPRSPVTPTQSEQSEYDTEYLSSRVSRYFVIPQEGLVFPTEITLPSPTQSRADIIQFSHSLSIRFPTGWSRQRMIEWIRTRLDELDYSQTNNTWTRSRPVRLIPIGSTAEIPQMREIKLPEIVSVDIFHSRNSMINFIHHNDLENYIRSGRGRLRGDLERDIRGFLAEQGYSIDPRGNFVRRGGVIISGGLRYNDLVTAKTIVEFIVIQQTISITQTDLEGLNVTISNILSMSIGYSWPSLNSFAQEIGRLINVNSDVVKLAVILSQLNQMSNKDYVDILLTIGDTRSFRRSEERLQAIRNYIRTKINLITRNYERREPLSETAPQELTFEEAVHQGYRFTYEQYEDDIKNMLSDKTVPRNQLNYLIELLHFYPDMFAPMNTFNTLNTLANTLIEMYYNKEPSIIQRMYSFAVNYILVFPESPEKAQRRQRIDSLPSNYIETLYSIYSSDDIEVILDMDQHPLELYVIAISKVRLPQLRQLVAGFGMIVPEHLTNREIRHYVLRHMGPYKEVITRPQNTPPIKESVREQPSSVVALADLLKRYTDSEIIENFGYVGGFETREMLIENIYITISEEGFMIFNEIDRNIALNVETTMLDRVTDLPRPYLTFGTPFGYNVIGLDELIIAFREEDGKFRFQNIYGSALDNYTIAQVSRLQTLLPMMKATNPQLTELVNQVLERVRIGIVRNIRRNRTIDRIMKEIERQTPELKDLIKDLFHKIFYAGMYMRRWLGPGNRYPVRDVQTQGGTNPEPRVIAILGEVFNLMEQIENSNQNLANGIRELPDVDYNSSSGDVIFRTEVLFNYVTRAAEGDYCIRQASRHLVISAYYYLSVIFSEIVPDFDPHSVDAIS